MPASSSATSSVGGPHVVVGHPLHTARDRPVASGEHLVASRVEHRHDEAVRMTKRIGEEVEARHAHHRHSQRLRHDLRSGHSDAQAGEQPGPHVDGDGRELFERHAELLTEVADGGRELLGVPAPSSEADRADRRAAIADRDRDGRRRGVDREQHHAGASGCESVSSVTSAASASLRTAHVRPAPTKVRSRSSSRSP